MNRSIRRAAEKKAIREGTSPVQILKSLSNLEGVATLSTKLEEFLVASQKMEAIADKLDEAETLEQLQNVRRLATTFEEQIEGLYRKQALQSQVVVDLIEYLMGGKTPDSQKVPSPYLEVLVHRLKGA